MSWQVQHSSSLSYSIDTVSVQGYGRLQVLPKQCPKTAVGGESCGDCRGVVMEELEGMAGEDTAGDSVGRESGNNSGTAAADGGMGGGGEATDRS